MYSIQLNEAVFSPCAWISTNPIQINGTDTFTYISATNLQHRTPFSSKPNTTWSSKFSSYPIPSLVTLLFLTPGHQCKICKKAYYMLFIILVTSFVAFGPLRYQRTSVTASFVSPFLRREI